MRDARYLMPILAAAILLQACGGGSDSLDIELSLDVATGDIDGDGEIDMVFAHTDTGPSPDEHRNSVFINRGGGRARFSLTQHLRIPARSLDRPELVELGDLDNDGNPDAVFANGDSIYLALRSTISAGRFLAPRRIAASGINTVMAIGDLNQDSIKDLAYAGANGNLAILIQDSLNPGRFLPPVDLGFATISAAIGDLDGDLINDIASVDPNTNQIRILRQNPGAAGSFTLAGELDAGSNLASVQVADLDQDTRADLAAVFRGNSNLNVSGGVSVLLQDPANPGQFLAAVEYAADANGFAFDVGDLNDDGFADIVVSARPFGNSARIVVLFQDNASPGNFPTRLVITGDVLLPDAIEIADMDGDLLNDLIVSDVSLFIRYQRGAAPGSFTGNFEIFEP